jgi:hypothetical protein
MFQFSTPDHITMIEPDTAWLWVLLSVLALIAGLITALFSAPSRTWDGETIPGHPRVMWPALIISALAVASIIISGTVTSNAYNRWSSSAAQQLEDELSLVIDARDVKDLTTRSDTVEIRAVHNNDLVTVTLENGPANTIWVMSIEPAPEKG